MEGEFKKKGTPPPLVGLPQGNLCWGDILEIVEIIGEFKRGESPRFNEKLRLRVPSGSGCYESVHFAYQLIRGRSLINL
jgi:hypothetical protein